MIAALAAGFVLASPHWQGDWGVAYAPATASGAAARSAPTESASSAAARSAPTESASSAAARSAPTGSPPGGARGARAAPIVFLHGMWAGPEEQCPALEHAATRFGLFVCPRGNAPFGDGRMWAGTYADAARQIHAALAEAEALARVPIARDGGGTLVGYSNGAYFAAEVACAERGRWTSLVLLAMKVDLDPERLRAAGVRRVVLAAGDRDGSRAAMSAQAERLNTGRVVARFVSLGPGAHELPPDIDARIGEMLAWARAD